MSNDDKFQRKPGAKPAGFRGRKASEGRTGAGKPGTGKAGKPSFAAKKKPFAKRPEGAPPAAGPKRGFKRDDRDGKPREATREGRAFGTGPRAESRGPYKGPDRGVDGGRDKGVDRGPDRREGPRKPFAPRKERPAREEGERGEKRFERPRRDFGGERQPPRAHGRRFGPAEGREEVGERIAKRLARAGIASRRDAEELIAAGRVKVNGKVLESPAFNVRQNDIIHLDGMEIPPIERTRLFLFHKPAGVVTTNRDPEGRKTVFDVLPAGLPRLMTVGRLDINTEGLLLLTNDGGLSRVLELPATGWLRRYRVRVHGKVEEDALKGLREGIAVDGVFYGAVEASLDREQGTNAWLTIGLREGKNREVRNILGALGLEVTRLIRISYGPFQLNELPEGHVLEIKGRMLRDQLGERLVEESGANFDAEIVKPFSNRPTRRTEARKDTAPRPRQPRAEIGEGGLIKRRKFREGSRDEALAKLSTRPERGWPERGRPERGQDERGDRPKPGAPGGKPGSRKGERDGPKFEPSAPRKANVWMAPGARPQRKDGAEDGKARTGGRPPYRKGPGKGGPKAR